MFDVHAIDLGAEESESAPRKAHTKVGNEDVAPPKQLARSARPTIIRYTFYMFYTAKTLRGSAHLREKHMPSDAL